MYYYLTIKLLSIFRGVLKLIYFTVSSQLAAEVVKTARPQRYLFISICKSKQIIDTITSFFIIF